MDSTNHVRLRFMESFELYIFPRDLFIFSFRGTKKVVDGIGRHLVPSRPRIRFRTKAATSVARRASSRLGWKCRIPNGRKPADAGTHFRPDPDSLSFYRRNPWLNHSWPSLSLLPFLSFNFRWNIGIFRGVGIIIVYPQRYIFIAFQFYFNNVTATRLYRFLSLSLSILLCVYIYIHIFYTTTRLYLFKINFDFRSLRFIKKKVDIFAR